MGLGSGSGGGSSGGIRAGRAYVELTLKDNALYRGLDKLNQRMAQAGKALRFGGAAAAAAGAGVGGSLLAAGKLAIDRNTQIAGLASKLQVSTEDLSGLAYAAEQTGNSFEDLQGHFENFSERIGQAADGTGEASAAFQKLGLDATRLKNIPITQALEETLAAIAKLASPTEQLAVLSSLGGDQFQKLAVLARMGGAGLAGLRKEALLVGAVLSTEDAAKAVAAQRSLNGIYAAGASVVRELGMALLPTAEQAGAFRDAFARGAAQVREFLDANRQAVQGVALASAALFVGGSAFVAVGTALGGASLAAAGFLSAVVAAGSAAAFAAPWVAGAAAIGLFDAALFHVVTTQTSFGARIKAGMMEAAESAQKYLGEMWSNAKATYSGIGDAMSAGDLRLAAQIGMAGLDYEWKRGLVVIQEAWNKFDAEVVEVFRSGWTACKVIWNDFTAAIETGMSHVKQRFNTTFGGIIALAVKGIPKLISVIETSTDAIGGYFSLMSTSATDAMNKIQTKFRGVFGPIAAF